MASCSPCVRLWYKFGSRPKQIFVILVVLRQSLKRIAGPISAARRLGYTAPKNVVAVASRWQHCADLTEPGCEP